MKQTSESFWNNLIEHEEYKPESKPPDVNIEDKISSMIDETLSKISTQSGEPESSDVSRETSDEEETIIEENEDEKED